MWQIEVPQVAPWINSNDRTYWAKKAQHTKAWKAAADVAARNRGGYFTCPVRIVCTYHKTRGGRWDVGNLQPTSKALVDGLVAAGVIYDDSNEYVVGPDNRAGAKRAQACVVIRIEPIREASSE